MKVETKNEKYFISPLLSIVFPKEHFELSRFKKKLDNGKIFESIKLSDNYIKKKFANCSQIVFEVTEECNFRCKYCAYSGIYEKAQIHRNRHMSFEIAKLSLDVFSRTVFSGLRTRKDKITIGFYGGEPLLRFNFIKRLVNYSKLISDESGQVDPWQYQFTTNGSLLKPNVIDYIKKNDFKIMISIDGPADEHDKFRVLKGGGLTWEIIWNNILYIKKHFPEYFNKRVKFQLTLHPDHNLLRIEEFFKKNQDIFTKENTDYSTLKIKGLKGDISKNWIEGYRKSIYQINKMDNKFWLKEKFFSGDNMAKFQKRTLLYKYCDKFTGNCFPGERKVFITTNGKFSVCEKINPGHYIGDYKNGFDLIAIKELEEKWNQLIQEKKCWECNHWFICNTCYVNCDEREGTFKVSDEYCKNLGKEFLSEVFNYLKLLEDRHEDIRDNTNSIVNFIEQL
jgi:uncharacterized protein